MGWRRGFEQSLDFFILFGHCLVPVGLGKRNKGYKNPRDLLVSMSAWRCLGLPWGKRIEEGSWGSQKTVIFWGVMGVREIRAYDAKRL